MKLLPYILFEKYINILALEMTCPGNRHCANCTGTLSLPIKSAVSCQDDVKMLVWLSVWSRRYMTSKSCDFTGAGWRSSVAVSPTGSSATTTAVTNAANVLVLILETFSIAAISPGHMAVSQKTRH